jgi:hypothetical protein
MKGAERATIRRPNRRRLSIGHLPGELPGGIDVGKIRVAAAEEQGHLTIAEIPPYDLGTLFFQPKFASSGSLTH